MNRELGAAMDALRGQRGGTGAAPAPAARGADPAAPPPPDPRTGPDGDPPPMTEQVLDDPFFERLSPTEKDTMLRAQAQHPELELKTARKERDGEYVDKFGRTYDQMGDPAASLFWSERGAQQFFNSIDHHLRKSANFVLMDLTGFSDEAVKAIRAYVNGLPADHQSRIMRIGF
jgi:hypothetical protein